MKTDINSTLLVHLATGAGAASLLRQDRPELISVTQSFFEARTDIRRLDAAQEVAQLILSRNDLHDLIEIRDIVAKQELRRQIKYGNQQDHTAHTVYLYFLGLWLYDHLPELPAAIGKECHAQEPVERDRYFLLQWAYASLLHDVGYAFHNLDAETQKDRQKIDSVFSLDWIKGQCSGISAAAEAALAAAHGAWMSKFGVLMLPGTGSCGPGSYTEVLQRLAQAPWLADLLPEFQGKDIFDVLDSTSSIRNYAFEVAREGYGGDGHCVDHAVASGLFLFQYTSFWYWIVNTVKADASIEIYNEITSGLNYEPENLVTDFVAACKAVAFHNIQPKTRASKLIIPTLTLDNEPITFLGVLCDELQRWDRSPAGWARLDEYRLSSKSALEAGDLQIMVQGTRESPIAFFVVRERNNNQDRNNELSKLAKAFRDDLQKRLPEYSNVLLVAVRSFVKSDSTEEV